MSGINNHHTDADDSIVDNFDPLILDNRFTTTNGTNGTGTATMTMSTPLPTFDAEKKKKPRKKRRSNVTKKPPDAPKRFKRYVLVIYSIYRYITLCLRNTEHGNIMKILLLTSLLYPTLSMLCRLFISLIFVSSTMFLSTVYIAHLSFFPWRNIKKSRQD